MGRHDAGFPPRYGNQPGACRRASQACGSLAGRGPARRGDPGLSPRPPAPARPCGGINNLALCCSRRAVSPRRSLLTAARWSSTLTMSGHTTTWALRCSRVAISPRRSLLTAVQWRPARLRGGVQRPGRCAGRSGPPGRGDRGLRPSAIPSKPDDVRVHNNRGVAFKDQGHIDNALACFRRAIASSPTLPRRQATCCSPCTIIPTTMPRQSSRNIVAGPCGLRGR